MLLVFSHPNLQTSDDLWLVFFFISMSFFQSSSWKKAWGILQISENLGCPKRYRWVIRLSSVRRCNRFLAPVQLCLLLEKFRLTLFGQRGFLMSDMRSDTIISLIGSVKNVGWYANTTPHKNVDHATKQRPEQLLSTDRQQSQKSDFRALPLWASEKQCTLFWVHTLNLGAYRHSHLGRGKLGIFERPTMGSKAWKKLRLFWAPDWFWSMLCFPIFKNLDL